MSEPRARAGLERRLQAAWTGRGPLACALWPLSQLTRLLTAARRAVYRHGWRTAERLPVPVIVVGNVVAGGAGKTPTTLALVRHLQARGWHPGIVSRGYGRATTDLREVHANADPRAVGDEPLLLHLRSGAPVVVAARRADAGRALLAAHPEVDVLVCDDGLQHLALARDIEIAVFDARGIGNGWLLPAGPLREPWPRRPGDSREPWPRPVDLVLWTEAAAPEVQARVRAGLPAMDTAAAPEGPDIAAKAAPTSFAPSSCFSATRRLADHALRADGTRVPLQALRGQALTALAAIARPQAFFDMLRNVGLTLARCIAFPDHYSFDSCPRNIDADMTLICTEKDALKLWRHRPDALALPLVLDLPTALLTALDERLLRPAAGAGRQGDAE